MEKEFNNLQESKAELENKYNLLIRENKILLEKNNSLENDLINSEKENKNINNSLVLLNKKYKELYTDYNSLNNLNESTRKCDLKDRIISQENSRKDITSAKIIPSKNIVGKLKQDLFSKNQKIIELNNLIEQNQIKINNYETKLKEKEEEIINYNKIIQDLTKLRNKEDEIEYSKDKTNNDNLEEYKEKIKTLEKQLEEANNKIKEYENEINNIKIKNDESKKEE